LPARRIIGLIGHNGSGKSTLIKLLARQNPLSAGKISFDGKDVHEWGSRPFARKVAYLPQQAPDTAGMLVSELVALGRYPWHGALGRFGLEDKMRVEEAMRLTDVARYRARFIDTLSGGERQRVWLAMLVAQNPDCLLLDEPTSALDIAHQIDILTLVRRLVELIARGGPEDIVAPDQLQAIYETRMGVMRHPDSGLPLAYPRS
jgi:iron complex transport system ATP-binding protein